jgi:hypothetical protein
MMTSSRVSHVSICCLCRHCRGGGGESYRELGRPCLRRLDPHWHVYAGWPVSLAVPYGVHVRSVLSTEKDGIPTVHITGIIYTLFCLCVYQYLIVLRDHLSAFPFLVAHPLSPISGLGTFAGSTRFPLLFGAKSVWTIQSSHDMLYGAP